MHMVEQQHYCVTLFYKKKKNWLVKISILALPFKKLPKNLETVTSNKMIKKIVRGLKRNHEKTFF